MKDLTAPQSPGKRAAAYWFVDGLPELGFGIIYLIWSSLGILSGTQPNNHRMKWAVVAAAVAFLIFFCWDRKILDFVKARFTYPRTGYARPPKDAQAPQADAFVTLEAARPPDENVTYFRMRTAFLFFVAMQVVNMASTAYDRGAARWAVPVVMTATAALEYYWSRDDARPYSLRSVSAIAAAGWLTLARPLPARSTEFYPLLIGGLWLSAHGLWTLIRYLRDHPEPQYQGTH
jgi:hypothetical protein